MPDYRDPSLPIPVRVDALLAQMTLAEKIGQITQVEKNSLTPAAVTDQFIGSVLSGGGGAPASNTLAGWRAMVADFQQAARQTRLGIPLLYGVDAVHGHNNVCGATIFPHNIGLGAAGDVGLVERIGRATAEDLLASGIQWNFAPTVALPHDIRWGRTYEGYSQDPALVSALGAAYLRGLHSTQPAVAGSAKHFIGDGSTTFGSSLTNQMGKQYLLDQGDTNFDEARLRACLLPPYQAAIAAGVQTIMVSFNGWQGVKMHAHHYLLTEVLKGELGFSGFLISDWQAIDQIPGDYHHAVVASLNAGLDMVMVPFAYEQFIATATQAVCSGEVPLARLDDAIRRILTVKFQLGLFEQPTNGSAAPAGLGGDTHRSLAREAVRRSLVLLKNDHAALPIATDIPLVYVAGAAADDVGLQCGGWTISWQGERGEVTAGTSILTGLRAALSPQTRLEYDAAGQFSGRAPVGIVVVAEEPYAEGHGDRDDLTLPAADAKLIAQMRARCERLILVVLSGRPLIITDQVPLVDTLVAAWLPGTEGAGVADVLCGEQPFTGRLSFTWPRSMRQIPDPPEDDAHPLFPRGYGL